MTVYIFTTILFAVLWIVDRIRYKKATADNDWRDQLTQFAITGQRLANQKAKIFEDAYDRLQKMYDKHYGAITDAFIRALNDLEGRDDWE